jgi:hypothetical protein
MPEVSREPSPDRLPGVGDEVGGTPAVARETPRIFDLLGCDGLGDVGMHCPFLSIESCFATAIRMN